jgi:hypothetical protein
VFLSDATSPGGKLATLATPLFCANERARLSNN